MTTGPERPEDPEPDLLPQDPDIDVEETAAGAPRPPVHLHPGYLALVLIGGALGTAAREGLSLAFPYAGGVPVVIFGINLAGAFLLGLLLDALARRGPDHGRRRTLRLLLGTGVMGGFTTYSTLAADAARLIGEGAGSAWIGALYALATVVAGALATWAGLVVAELTHADSRSARRATKADR